MNLSLLRKNQPFPELAVQQPQAQQRLHRGRDNGQVPDVFRAEAGLCRQPQRRDHISDQTQGRTDELRPRIAQALKGARTHEDQALRDEYGPQLLRTILPTRAALRHAAGVQQSVFRYASPDAAEVRALFVELVDELLQLDEAA